MRACFQIHESDNVATVLADVEAEGIEVRGVNPGLLEVTENVALGHKVALADIPEGGHIIKFGVPIGRATCPIAKGAWVHLHNCASFLDERSQTLDLHSGAATDTVYE